MKKSLTAQTVWGFFWLACGKGSRAFIQIGILVVLARLLSPSEFGLMAMALIVVSFSDIFADIGLGPAVTQKKELSEEDVKTSFSFSILLGLALLLAVMVLSPMIASFFKNEKLTLILRAVSPILFLKSLSSTATGLLLRRLKYKDIALIELVSYTLGYGVVGIIFAWLDFGVWALVLAVNGQALLAVVLKILAAKHPKKFSISRSSLKALLIFGAGYSLGKIFSYLGEKGDKIIVGKLLGTDALGLYDRAYHLVRFLSHQFNDILDRALFSPVARKQSMPDKIGKVYLELVYIISILLIPASIFFFMNAKEIVDIVLGRQWTAAGKIVKIMSLCLFFFVMNRIGTTFAKAMGDVYRRAWRSLIYALAIVIGSLFSAKWGIEGVATAVLTAVFLNFLMTIWQINTLLNLSLPEFLRMHWHGVICAASYFVISLAIHGSILMNVGVFICVFIMSLIIFDKKVFFKYLNVFLKNTGNTKSDNLNGKVVQFL